MKSQAEYTIACGVSNACTVETASVCTGHARMVQSYVKFVSGGKLAAVIDVRKNV